MTIVGKTEIHKREIWSGHFLVHKCLRPSPPPLLSFNTSLPLPIPPQECKEQSREMVRRKQETKKTQGAAPDRKKGSLKRKREENEQKFGNTVQKIRGEKKKRK